MSLIKKTGELMKNVILSMLLLASVSSFAGALTIETSNSFPALDIGLNDTSFGVTTIDLPDYIFNSTELVTFENKRKQKYFKSLIDQMEDMTNPTGNQFDRSAKVRILDQIMKKTLRKDFINHQKMIIPYYKSLNLCLNDLAVYKDDYKYFNYKCDWSDSDAVFEALENVRALSKNTQTYVKTVDNQISVPGLGYIEYNKENESYRLESTILTESGKFRLAAMDCDSSRCLVKISNGHESFVKDMYLQNHPTSTLN